jgi:hypothetical protein
MSAASLQPAPTLVGGGGGSSVRGKVLAREPVADGDHGGRGGAPIASGDLGGKGRGL